MERCSAAPPCAIDRGYVARTACDGCARGARTGAVSLECSRQQRHGISSAQSPPPKIDRTTTIRPFRVNVSKVESCCSPRGVGNTWNQTCRVKSIRRTYRRHLCVVRSTDSPITTGGIDEVSTHLRKQPARLPKPIPRSDRRFRVARAFFRVRARSSPDLCAVVSALPVSGEACTNSPRRRATKRRTILTSFTTTNGGHNEQHTHSQ